MTPDPAPTPEPTNKLAGYARAGSLLLALLVMASAVFVVFTSAIDAIQTWFDWKWVPVARGVFGLLVAALAVWVVQRLTRVKVG